MGVIFQSGYVLPFGDMPLTHARIAHAGNWLSGGTAVASTTATDYFANGPLNSMTYEGWKPTALAATWEYNHGSAAQCDYCCIGAHTMGTSGNSLQVQYWDGAAWQNLIPTTAITNDMAVMAIFGRQTRQRWRINITGGTAPEIGVVKFGLSMQMPRPMFGGHSPLELSRQTELRSNDSETGEFLGRTKQRVTMATGFAWQHLDDAWVRSTFRPFQKAMETEPFFIAWRPSEYSEAALCRTDSVPVPQNMGIRNLMAVEMSVRAYAYD